jgi:hypothetical protein
MASIISAGTSTGTALNLTGDTSGVLQLASNNGTTALTIDTSQNVAVGTTSALNGGKLSVLADTSVGQAISLRDSASTYANNDNYIYFTNNSAATVGGITHPAATSLGVWGYTDVRFFTQSSAVEAMRITSAGNVGIGLTNPTNPLEVYQATGAGGTTAIKIGNGTASGYTELRLNNSGASGKNYYIGVGGNGAGAPYANNLYAYDADNNVACTVTNRYGLGVGAAQPSSGTGIAFPATQSASSDANTLDDYEEGNWTPALSFNGNAVGLSYSNRLGLYTKVGNIVTVQFYLLLSAKGSSTGSALIGGLPFPAFNNGGIPLCAGVLVNESGGTSFPSGTYMLAWLDGNLYLRYNNGTAFGQISDGNMGNSTALYGSITYRVA